MNIRITVLSILSLAFACAVPVAPTVVAPGSYVLASVNGQPVPYLTSTVTIYSGALDVGTDGKFNAVTCFSSDEPCYAPIAASRNVIEHGTFRVTQDTLTLWPLGNPTRYLVSPTLGVLIQHPGPLQPDQFAGLTLQYSRK